MMPAWLSAMGKSAGNAAAAGAGNSVGQFAGDFSDWMTNAATGGLWGKYQDKQFGKERGRQNQLNEDAAMINFKYGEMAADEAMRRASEMYEKYESYGAQKRQMEAAGLNPALMYGMGGGSGGNVSSGAQGGGASGTATPMNQASMMMAAQQERSVGLEQQMLMAQIQNINADTKEKEASAGSLDTGVRKMEVEMAAITENIENTKVVRESYRLDNQFKSVQNAIQSATKETVIKTAEQELENLERTGDKLAGEAMSAYAKGEIDLATVEIMIKTKAAQLSNIIADTAEKYSEASLNNEQMEYVSTYAVAATVNSWANRDEVLNNREKAAAMKSQAEAANEQARIAGKRQRQDKVFGYIDAALKTSAEVRNWMTSAGKMAGGTTTVLRGQAQ